MPADYRPTRFEALTGEPIDATTRDGLQRLCDASVTEADDLEFKGKFYEARNQADNYEAAKDVAALANRSGGVIVIGIVRSEPDGRAERLEDIPLGDVDVDRLHQVIADRVAPMCDFDVHRVPEGGTTGQYLIVVPPSALAPHAVMRDNAGQTREPLTYWVRNGATSRAMPEAEVADRYRARFASGSAQRERLDALLAESSDALHRVGHVWLQLALAPARPGRVAIAKRRELLDTACEAQASAPPSLVEVNGGMTVTVGHRRIVLTHDQPYSGRSRYGLHIEVLDDGAVSVACIVGFPVDDDTKAHGRGTISENAFVVPQYHLEAAVLGGLLLAARLSTRFAGAGGDATVAVRLTQAARDIAPPDIPWPITLTTTDHISIVRRVAGARDVSKPALSRRTVPLGAVASIPREAVAAAHMLCVDLLSQFGQPAVHSYTVDGDVIPAAWDQPQRVQAQNWAEANGVLVQRSSS